MSEGPASEAAVSEAGPSDANAAEPPRGGRRLFALVGLVADGMLVVMLLAILFQVAARYVFANPPFWTEELARYAMVWCGALGAALAFWHGLDPRFVEPGLLLGPKTRRVGAILALLPAAIFAGMLLYHSLFGPNATLARGFVARNLSRVSEALDLNMALVASAIPAMALLTLIAALLHAVALLREPSRPDMS